MKPSSEDFETQVGSFIEAFQPPVSNITDPTPMDEDQTRHSGDSMDTGGTVDTNMEDKLLLYDTGTIPGGATAPNKPRMCKA